MMSLRFFTVRADLPPELEGLRRLAANLRLHWQPQAAALFERLDAEAWRRHHGNAPAFLDRLDPQILQRAATDSEYTAAVAAAAAELDGHLAAAPTPQVAYFSMEYGLAASLPLYAGGLGILSGDHVKAASDRNLPFLAVGLMYHQGYFRQALNEAGQQEEIYLEADLSRWPIQPVMDPERAHERLVIQLRWPDRDLYVQAWRLQVGRTPLFLLDTRRTENTETDRRLTDRLYGGDREYRLQQEMLLGIGGTRLLEHLKIDVPVFHLNEGHSAFAPFERMRRLMRQQKLAFAEAQQLVFHSTIFTTHTPVPAGNDVFEPGLVLRYLGDLAGELGLQPEEFLDLGRQHPGDGREGFSMTVAALRHCVHVNAVSRLHGRVSRRMWSPMWPQVPEDEIPIMGLTNGVHLRTWISAETDSLLNTHLGDDWDLRQSDSEMWQKGVAQIPAADLWRARESARGRMVEQLRQRLAAMLHAQGAPEHRVAAARHVLDPHRLTIGLARRFATYKRGNLILRDPARVLRLLRHETRPIQILFAGKAHPLDGEGKQIIQQIVRFLHEHQVEDRVVFVEDYDMEVARLLVGGVDVWLNTPLRPLEACGTSGMKVAACGGLNLSVLDGWWDEAYDGKNGWGLGGRRMQQDPGIQNAREGRELLEILESDVIPRFYQRDEQGIPGNWIRMMRASLATIPARFNTHRMVDEYHELYRRAAADFDALAADGFASLTAWSQWRRRVLAAFPAVRVVETDLDVSRPMLHGRKVPVSVIVDTAGLVPRELDVSLMIRRRRDGNPDRFFARALSPETEKAGKAVRYSAEIEPPLPGDYEAAVRVTPRHERMHNPYELFVSVWS
ncbi:MAG: alpha-glucan family phosphorylase [Acidobacteriota bacterium]|jgi:starch phosphorylase|nr:alpha-glucan family phosphorylase [Acidobacteriota bacterium]